MLCFTRFSLLCLVRSAAIIPVCLAGVIISLCQPAGAEVKPSTLLRPGLAVLALQAKSFPVNDLIRVYARSNSKHASFAFLYGSFGRSPANYVTLMDFLAAHKEKVTVSIYLLSGPSRPPRRPNSSMVTFFSNLNIKAFNRALEQNRYDIRAKFRTYAQQIKSKFVDAYPQANFYIVPELEDNCTVEARSQLVKILQRLYRDSANVSIRINPIVNIPNAPTLSFETHAFGSLHSKLKPGDAISEDGSLLSDQQSLAEMRNHRWQGLDYYLWRCEWQGTCSGTFLPPGERHYSIPNIAALANLLD